MIEVRIHFHGAIDRRGLAQDHAVQIADGATVEQLLRQIGYADREIRFIVPMVGGERVHSSHVLEPGVTLDVLAPAGGG